MASGAGYNGARSNRKSSEKYARRVGYTSGSSPRRRDGKWVSKRR
jgi:hypothetical protein